MELHRPDEDAYGRVTNPDRYQVVVDAARAIVDRLVAGYEVESESGDPAVDFPDFRGEADYVTRLRPSEGAPLGFMFTGFPGVVVRAGEWCVEPFPVCGCDACDELPQDVMERLDGLVTAVVEGRYSEGLTETALSYEFWGHWSSCSNDLALEPGEWRRFGQKGTRNWPAWAERRTGIR